MVYATYLKLIENKNSHDVICSVEHPSPEQTKYKKLHIRSVSFFVNDAIAAEIQLGKHVSQDPIFGIQLSNLKPDDMVSVVWVNSRSVRGHAQTKVK